MAIQFARCEFIKRSEGGNSCRSSAYNGRQSIKCENTGNLYYFKNRSDNIYHEVMLPDGASEMFLNPKFLWNQVELIESRKNSQVACELVLALPSNDEISNKDRIEIARGFAKQYFVDKGLAVQVDVHAPHDDNNNWHAHLLMTTRRFSVDGLGWARNKARDLHPQVRKGMVTEADQWGAHFREYQNAYFQDNGIDLRVDAIGIVPEKHIGPVRMRGITDRAEAISLQNNQAKDISLKDTDKVLSHLTKHQTIFTREDVENVVAKNLFVDAYTNPSEIHKDTVLRILNHTSTLSLRDPESGVLTPYFTTKIVRDLEMRAMRFSGELVKGAGFSVNPKLHGVLVKDRTLNEEQKIVFQQVVKDDSNLKILEGRAGSGKSHVMWAIRESYERSGYRVIGMAPTGVVVRDMKRDGFKEALTCHSLLFQLNNNRNELDSKTVLMVDEAGMMGTSMMLEILNQAKLNKCKLILSGDSKQLPSVEFGGLFKHFSKVHGSALLSQVNRQQVDWQRQVSMDLSRGRVHEALTSLNDNDRIKWSNTQGEGINSLVNIWCKNVLKADGSDVIGSSIVLAQKNVHVDIINSSIRDVLRQNGYLGEKEWELKTDRGVDYYSEGDRIQLSKTDKSKYITAGTFGFIKKLEEKLCVVSLDDGSERQFNPEEYKYLRHGYACTVYKAQGKTVDNTYVYIGPSRHNTFNSLYVALTRQRNNVTVFASGFSNENKQDIEALVRTCSKESSQVSSLSYATEQDLDAQRTRGGFIAKASQDVASIVTKLKDAFHSNPNFYKYEKPIEEIGKAQLYDGKYVIEQTTHQELALLLERRMHTRYIRQNDEFPGGEKLSTFSASSHRAASYLFDFKDQQGRDPTYAEMEKKLQRAIFETTRLPEIKKEYLNTLSASQKIIPEDYLRAQLYANRLATIEGRLFELNLEHNKPIHNNIYETAKIELQKSMENRQKMGEKIQEASELNPTQSDRLANEMIQFKEKHGVIPSPTVLENLTQVALYLEKRSEELSSSFKGVDPYISVRVIEFLSRNEADAALTSLRGTGCINNESVVSKSQAHLDQQKIEAAKIIDVQNAHSRSRNS